MKKYVYIFVRQDISPEQQIVQASHVTLKLGYTQRSEEVEKECEGTLTEWLDPDNTYFTVVGVRDPEALNAVKMILCQFGVEYVDFFELDIDSFTAVATVPIAECNRGPLLAFNLLKIPR